MKKIIRQEFPWFLAHALWFWCIPMLYSGIESALEVAYLMLLAGNPLFCMIVSLLYGMKYGRRWGFLVYPVVAWFPSMLLHYNSTAMVFVVIAWFCAAVGLIFGGWLRNRRLSNQERWEESHTLSAQPEKAAPSASAAPSAAPRVASKTAAKNQQKAAARKAKERAEKEQKLREKNQPKPTKKKRR